jgi:hypothetical protein
LSSLTKNCTRTIYQPLKMAQDRRHLFSASIREQVFVPVQVMVKKFRLDFADYVPDAKKLSRHKFFDMAAGF